MIALNERCDDVARFSQRRDHPVVLLLLFPFNRFDWNSPILRQCLSEPKSRPRRLRIWRQHLDPLSQRHHQKCTSIRLVVGELYNKMTGDDRTLIWSHAEIQVMLYDFFRTSFHKELLDGTKKLFFHRPFISQKLCKNEMIAWLLAKFSSVRDFSPSLLLPPPYVSSSSPPEHETIRSINSRLFDIDLKWTSGAGPNCIWSCSCCADFPFLPIIQSEPLCSESCHALGWWRWKQGGRRRRVRKNIRESTARITRQNNSIISFLNFEKTGRWTNSRADLLPRSVLCEWCEIVLIYGDDHKEFSTASSLRSIHKKYSLHWHHFVYIWQEVTTMSEQLYCWYFWTRTRMMWMRKSRFQYVSQHVSVYLFSSYFDAVYLSLPIETVVRILSVCSVQTRPNLPQNLLCFGFV